MQVPRKIRHTKSGALIGIPKHVMKKIDEEDHLFLDVGKIKGKVVIILTEEEMNLKDVFDKSDDDA